MTPAETLTQTDDDDLLLHKFLLGANTSLASAHLGSHGSSVYHQYTGFTLVMRGAGRTYLLSLDRPGMWMSQSVINDWRRKVMAAACFTGVAVLPVAPASFTRAAHGAPPATTQVVEVNDQFESVFALDDRYYLSGYDTQESTPLYFLCRLPGAVETIDAARESLKPASVKAALAAGIEVVRQGDIFAIKSDLSFTQLQEMGARRQPVGDNTPIYGTAHTAPELLRLPGGVMLAKGYLAHRPSILGQSRSADHSPRPLGGELPAGDGGWWRLTRNTVPVF